MAEDDGWVDVAPPKPDAAPAAAADDGWVSVGTRAPATSPSAPSSNVDTVLGYDLNWSGAAKSLVNQTSVGSVMRAFGQGFSDTWGPEKLGLSDQSVQWLSKQGVFAPAGQTHFQNPFQAFNEGVMMPAAAALDGAIRTANATYRGLQEAGMAAGLHRDIVSLPDAFMGSPGALGEIKMRSGLPHDQPVGRIEPSPQTIDTPAGPVPAPPSPGLTAYHGSPHDFDAFSTAAIGTGEGAQAYGHGLYFAENEGIAVGYRNKLSEGSEGHLYQVRISADQDKMLDWDKPLNEQSPGVQESVKRAMGIDYYGNFDQAKSDRMWEQFGKADAGAAVRQGLIASDDQLVSKRLSDAGIPGIKYLDQGSRGAGDGTRNFVVFNEGDVQITHKNGEPIVTPQQRMAQARDMGVIGEERPPISEGTPAEAAQRSVMAADAKPGDKIVGPEPGGAAPNPWRERFDHFVGKVNTGDDVKQLITDAADQNNDFPQARAGDIPLQQFDDLTKAAGVDATTVDRSGVGRLLHNDDMVRNAMQGMLSATDAVKDAARAVKTDGSEASLMKLQEAMLRRDTWVEQVVGHRAEWGRTGNVFQEFLKRSKEENGFTEWLKDHDRSPDGLKKIADSIDNLDPAQTAKFLSDANKPTFWDKFKFYWVNALISGPITHAKYIVANAAFAGYDAAVVTPVAGAVGTVRRALTGGEEGVFAGEAAAKAWGLVAGTPDAIRAAVQAAKTGLQTPLPGELAQGIVPKRNQNVAYQQRPIPGMLGAVIGVPSKGASAIHSFFNFLGYRASIEAQAYRQAAKEGLSVADDAFWQRREAMAATPSEDMMNAGIEDGYRLTYISELGDTGKKLSAFVNSTKVGQLIMPFTHIPLNILKRATEGTPAAFLDADTRAALKGEQGAAKQDMAIARMVAGSAVGAWAVNQVLNERMTGYGPTDPKERAQWMATGHQPYSIRIGDEWLSFNRFGSLGTMLGLYANLAEVIPHMKPDAEELTKAIGMTVHSTGRLMEDEVGMQGLAGLMDAIDEPDRKGARFISNFAGSLLPYSSLLRQVGSSSDPYMRETKSVVDGLRYYIPVARQGLLPKRDWSGTPVANASYGGDLPVPGASSIIQHRSAIADPVAQELAALDIKPAPPADRIKGVKLPPQLYDIYQSTAGPFTRTALEHYVNAPGWQDMPIGVRAEIFRRTIASTREAAGAAMQMRYPQLIQQGVEDRMNRINGGKPGKLQDVSAP